MILLKGTATLHVNKTASDFVQQILVKEATGLNESSGLEISVSF